MLLGWDILRVHKVCEQISGPHGASYAQKLDLGWIIVGKVCLGEVHKTLTVKAFYTSTTERRRPTLFEPWLHVFNIKDKHCEIQLPYCPTLQSSDTTTWEEDPLRCNMFKQTSPDNRASLSIEDKAFVKIMEERLKLGENNSWTAPLPIKLSS